MASRQGLDDLPGQACPQATCTQVRGTVQPVHLDVWQHITGVGGNGGASGGVWVCNCTHVCICVCLYAIVQCALRPADCVQV